MQLFQKGKYLGVNKKEKAYQDILLSTTNYQKGLQSDWHYHENPYFTLILEGGSIEDRKSGSIECTPGQALFYNWQEPHRNLNYQTNSKSFNIELNLKWLKASGIDETTIAGNFYLSSPDVKFIMLKVLKEFTKDDDLSATSVHLCTLDLFHQFSKMNYSKHRPPWINQLKEILHDQWSNNLSLQQLSILLKVHPVTISKYFSKYFDCTLGEYVRRIRTEKALSLIKSTDMSLGAIAYECGFADQSHFIRTFKDHTGFLPKVFRRI